MGKKHFGVVRSLLDWNAVLNVYISTEKVLNVLPAGGKGTEMIQRKFQENRSESKGRLGTG